MIVGLELEYIGIFWNNVLIIVMNVCFENSIDNSYVLRLCCLSFVKGINLWLW